MKNLNPFDERLYLAYGSNLNIAQMHMRCKTAMAVRRFSINDWKLVFRDVADIEPSKGAVVHGALYRVTAADVAALDRYEGVKGGLYRQVTFRIKDTNELAFFYVMNADYIYPPSSVYYETIADGYLDWQIPLPPLQLALNESYEWLDGLEDEEMQGELDFAYEAAMRDDRDDFEYGRHQAASRYEDDWLDR